jgi:TolA-binding protein
LALREPNRTLELARVGNDAHPKSESAPERKWWQARALVELQRFSEARDLAREMVANFPDSPFAADARKHLLSHPFGLAPRSHERSD